MESKAELRQLGNAIRSGRVDSGLSQEDFAEAANVHRTYIGHIERAEANISFINILRIAKALRIKPSELFRRAGL